MRSRLTPTGSRLDLLPVCALMRVLVWPSIHQLRQTVSTEHTSLRQQEMDNMPRASYGYGGKFGLQEDRMDKVRPADRDQPWLGSGSL